MFKCGRLRRDQRRLRYVWHGYVYLYCACVSSTQRPQLMLERGLNTEHHAAPGAYVSFIYNDGSLVKWFRDTFALLDKQRAQQEGYEVYDHLFAEMPERPSKVMVLPHFL